MFLAEISSTALRGAIVVVYVLAHIFGSLICSFVTLATSKYEGDSSWQIPLASIFAFTCFVLVFCWSIPESPRWLVRKGRHDQAVKQLRWIRGSRLSEQDAETQMNTIKQSIEQDRKTKGRWSDFLKGNNRVSTVLIA
jgi:MFS family permease